MSFLDKFFGRKKLEKFTISVDHPTIKKLIEDGWGFDYDADRRVDCYIGDATGTLHVVVGLKNYANVQVKRARGGS